MAVNTKTKSKYLGSHLLMLEKVLRKPKNNKVEKKQAKK